MALETVQCSETPNDAWRSLKSHYRAKGTREILLLSHEVNRETMHSGKHHFQFMMEIARLETDLRRLNDRSVTELRKGVIIVAGLSVDYEDEVRMLENNPAGPERAEIERVVGNQYKSFLRQQQDSKALSASKSATIADRGEKGRKPHQRFKGNCFSCGRKGRRAEDCKSAKNKIEKSGDAPAEKEGEGREKCYVVCGSEEHFTHKHCGLWRILEHRIRDCED